MTAKLTIFGEIGDERMIELAGTDIAIVACGYESRAVSLTRVLNFGTARRCALRFLDQRVLAYNTNAAFLHDRGFDLIDLRDDQVRDWALAAIEQLSVADHDNDVTVFVDVSSQSRVRLAALVEALNLAGENRRIRVYFGYSLARYSHPSAARAPNVAIGPVSPFFAGWTRDPDLPLSLVVGLGYEPDRALGAVEHLEPSVVWAMMPHSSLLQYDNSLMHANRQLIDQIGLQNVLKYEVEDPNATLALLAALVGRLATDSSVLLLPSGPKVLVVLSMLLACTRGDISIWRVSAGANEPPVDRKPNGKHLIVECLFEPSGIEPDDHASAGIGTVAVGGD